MEEDVAGAEFVGEGAAVTLMICSMPLRWMASLTSPALKRSRRRDLSCEYRGCASNSSDAKCISGV